MSADSPPSSSSLTQLILFCLLLEFGGYFFPLHVSSSRRALIALTFIPFSLPFPCIGVRLLHGWLPNSSLTLTAVLPRVAPNRVAPAAVKDGPDGGGRRTGGNNKKAALIDKVT